MQYTMHFDSALPATAWTYWRWAFEPIDLEHLFVFPPPFIFAVMAGCTVALLAFTLGQARRRQWLPLVLLGWFAITLAPVVPLRATTSPIIT